MFLNSPMKGLTILALIIFTNSCSKEPDELKSPGPNESYLSLEVIKNNVLSDNNSFAEIRANAKFPSSANAIIVFKTDKGVFSNNSSTYSVNVSFSDSPTSAFIKYNKPDALRVTCTLFNKHSKEVYVNFLTSYPSQILMSPDSSSLKSSFNSKCLIKTKLLRQVGNVSENLIVNYYDSTANSSGNSIGTFLNSTYSDSQGQATVEYLLQDTSYHGFVYIKSYIDSDTGRIRGMNKIYIK